MQYTFLEILRVIVLPIVILLAMTAFLAWRAYSGIKKASEYKRKQGFCQTVKQKSEYISTLVVTSFRIALCLCMVHITMLYVYDLIKTLGG